MQMSVITKVWWIVYVVVLLQSALICVQGWQWQRQRSAVMQKTHTTVSSKGQPLHCKDSTSTLQDDLLHTKTKHNDLSSMINGKWRAPVVACLLLSLFAPQTSHATASSADAAAPVATFVQPENTLSKVFTLDSPSPKVQFHYPDDFINAPKLIKTHQEEVFFKSEAKKGFNAGLTVSLTSSTSIKLLKYHSY